MLDATFHPMLDGAINLGIAKSMMWLGTSLGEGQVRI